jgi:hypothetical protein
MFSMIISKAAALLPLRNGCAAAAVAVETV